MGQLQMDNNKEEIFNNAISAWAKFRKAFGRDLTPSFVAELYAARQVGLSSSRTFFLRIIPPRMLVWPDNAHQC